jgi:hypothetical protein
MMKWIKIKPAIWITFIPAKMHKNQPAITYGNPMGSELFDILKDFGLTDYESRVMESLLLNDSLTPGEIVSTSGISQPRV